MNLWKLINIAGINLNILSFLLGFYIFTVAKFSTQRIKEESLCSFIHFLDASLAAFTGFESAV